MSIVFYYTLIRENIVLKYLAKSVIFTKGYIDENYYLRRALLEVIVGNNEM